MGWHTGMRLISPMLVAGLVVGLLTGCAGDANDTDEALQGDDSAYVTTIDANELVGLAPSQVTGLLGPADFRRADGPAEIMQYRSPSCVLDLYLYRDDAIGDFRVRYLEARDRALTQQAPQRCLATVMRSRRVG